MFNILLSFGASMLTFLMKSSMVKWAVFFALWFVVTEFIQLLVPLLPGASALTGAFAQQTPGVWFVLDLFKVPFGISACLSAFVTRFMIRRLPFIG